ncbi:hypothetical protein IKN40_01050 [bacterium]|nr:hypothetical protein [bacterium]
MKIIEEHRGTRLICENCKSILEYLGEDIDYDYDKCEEYVRCPICDYKNYIN